MNPILAMPAFWDHLETPPLNGFTLFDRFASLFGLNYFLIFKIYTI